MLVLISYDVCTRDDTGQRRLRRVARICQDYGKRVQFSVFECNVDPGQWELIKQRLIEEIDIKKDSLRFYYLGSNWRRKIEHIGAQEPVDLEAPLIV